MQSLSLARRRSIATALAVWLLAISPASSRSDDIGFPTGESQTNTTGNTFGLALGLDKFAVDMVRRVGYDFGAQVRYPFRYAKKNPKRFLLGVAGVTTLILTDHHTRRAIAERSRLDEAGIVGPSTQLSRWGDGSSAIPLVLGLGVVGVLADSPRERETSAMLVEALVTSSMWTALIKSISGRERPREMEEAISEWEGPALFRGDDERQGLQSFPSGHSTGIWAVATILANRYPNYKIMPILGYGTAAAMGYSRMVLGAHWLSDVVVGGLIGYGCAKQVLSTHEPGHTAEDHRFGVGVDVMGDYKGLRMTYDF